VSIGVTCNTTDVTRGCRQLASELPKAGDRTGILQAQLTANRIRAGVPVRSGRLRSTVHAVPAPHGGAVTYGGNLPYARYIERRTHAVENGTASGAVEFRAAMTVAAAREVNRL
jgi:hypothetical protein